MLRCRFILLLMLSSLFSLAQNATEDYDSLSRLPSEQLMASGRTYFEQRQPGRALSCFTIVSERFKKTSDSEEARQSIRALNNCGCVYKYFFFDYTQAYECFTKAYDLCEQENDGVFLPVILVNLGDLLIDYGTHYNSQKLLDQSVEIFENCIQRAQETRHWELLVTAFFNLVSQKDDIDLSRYDIIFSEAIPDSTPDIHYVRLQYKGIASMQQQRYAEARQYFQQQLGVITTRWVAERDTLATYENIAKTYLKERDYVHAAEYWNKALDLSASANMIDLASGICKKLSECYREMGDSEMQRRYHLLYLEKMEEMHNSRLSSIGELNYINELKKEEMKAEELTARQRQQQFTILVIIVVLLVVIAFAVLLWRKNQQLQLRNKSLYEHYRQAMRSDADQKQMRYSHSRLNQDQREALVFQIEEVLADGALICQQDFSLSQLAKLVGSNTTYVSQVINEKFGMTFSNVLGNFRVREACRRISESREYENLTIEAIASNVGFKSRTAFINAFKREVGLTPSEYMKMAMADKKS